jgi:hypothetical protein
MHDISARISVFLFAILSQTGTAAAQPIPPEPSIFGITLGKPLSVPDCPYKNMAGYAFVDELAKISQICAVPAGKLSAFDRSNSKFRVHLPPPWPQFMNRNTFDLETRGGAVKNIFVLTTGVVSEQLVMEQLRNRLGSPAEERVDHNGNFAGAIFDVTKALWRFSDGSEISFTGALREAGVGAISAQTLDDKSQMQSPEASKL